MSDLIVRAVAESELDQVIRLIDQYDRPNAPHPDKVQQVSIFNTIEKTGGCVVGGFIEGKLVATCTLNICANLSWSGRPYGMIENVIVDVSTRNRGFGKRILSFAVSQARSADCYKVALMTGSKQASVIGFYESAGFSADKTGFQIRF